MAEHKTLKLYALITLVALICAAPVGFALLAYHQRWQLKTTNHGKLIQPVVFIDSIALKTPTGKPHSYEKKWTLLYLNHQPLCHHDCRHALHTLHQVHKALGEDTRRVVELLVAVEGHDKPALGLKTASLSRDSYQQLMRQLKLAKRQDMVFIVDPLGNMLMRYSPQNINTGMLRDLQKLLKVSRIG